MNVPRERKWLAAARGCDGPSNLPLRPASYATARTFVMKLSTSPVSEDDWLDKLAAAFNTPDAARPVSFAADDTVAILRVTVDVASAVCCTVFAISAVALLCSSMEAAMTRLMLETSSMVLTMPSIAETAFCVAPWISVIWALISSVAFAVCDARALTSEATTAKPRPASPARAASMVALSASRLVWPAMPLMNETTSPIFWAASARLCTRALDWRPSLAARPTTSVACASRRLISVIDDDSSSAAAATVCTFSEASAEADDTVRVCCRDCSTMADIERARGHSGDDVADAGLEIVGKCGEGAPLLRFGLRLGVGLRGLELVEADS